MVCTAFHSLLRSLGSDTQEVWLWNEFPHRAELGGGDTGIDAVALTAEGDFWAVQCKCVQADAVTDKPALDSFLSASGRSFHDRSGIERRFRHRLWISTAARWRLRKKR